LAFDALGGAGGVIHQTADLVEKPVAGLGHLERSARCAFPLGNTSHKTMAMPRPGIKAAPTADAESNVLAVYLVTLRFPCNRIRVPKQKPES
ncbi:hypothetical protein, partial [Acinetobacter baumannii]|uniref:hypothetical protein n=1 Tax=Acinetobacter baumannii TaxID=470 RepID=UPI0014879550